MLDLTEVTQILRQRNLHLSKPPLGSKGDYEVLLGGEKSRTVILTFREEPIPGQVFVAVVGVGRKVVLTSDLAFEVDMATSDFA